MTTNGAASTHPVVVADLVKAYGSFQAVAGVSFAIEPGEVFALLGPNGAGKSTTIEILEGYRRRTGGDVVVLGEDPGTAGRAWRARLGIVLQDSGMAPAATVAQLLGHFASLYPNPRPIDEVIAAVGLAEKAGTRVNQLSGGQRRRFDVALGIVGTPELLFLDEPTTGFDPEARREFWGLIRSLREEGTTIVLTTHYLDEAQHLSSRAGIIDRGRMIALGPIDELGGPDARVPRVRWVEDGAAREQLTREPAALVGEIAARVGEPEKLEVVRPTLEDVYLELVDNVAAEAAREER